MNWWPQNWLNFFVVKAFDILAYQFKYSIFIPIDFFDNPSLDLFDLAIFLTPEDFHFIFLLFADILSLAAECEEELPGCDVPQLEARLQRRTNHVLYVQST